MYDLWKTEKEEKKSDRFSKIKNLWFNKLDILVKTVSAFRVFQTYNKTEGVKFVLILLKHFMLNWCSQRSTWKKFMTKKTIAHSIGITALESLEDTLALLQFVENAFWRLKCTCKACNMVHSCRILIMIPIRIRLGLEFLNDFVTSKSCNN